MTWDANNLVNVSLQSVVELENPDLWDSYFRNVRGFLNSYDAPREKFGITAKDDGDFLAELRVLDPSGDSVAEIRRYRDRMVRAEGALFRALKTLPEDWESPAILNGLIRMFDEDRGPVDPTVVNALRQMKVTTKTLPDLVALAKSEQGFEPAVQAIARVATPEAMASLAKVGKRNQESPEKLAILDQAALDISIRRHDERAIPLLVHQLVEAYGNKFDENENPEGNTQPKRRPAEIIESILSIMREGNHRLPVELLIQLSGLGAAQGRAASEIDTDEPNPHLGISQAIVAKDLQPIRDAARLELEQRKMVS